MSGSYQRLSPKSKPPTLQRKKHPQQLWGSIFNKEILTSSRQNWLKASETVRRPHLSQWPQLTPYWHNQITSHPKNLSVIYCSEDRIWLNKPENVSEWMLTLDVPGHPHSSMFLPGWNISRTQNKDRLCTANSNTGLWTWRYFCNVGLLCTGSSSLPPWWLTQMPHSQHKGKSETEKVRTGQNWPLQATWAGPQHNDKGSGGWESWGAIRNTP